MVTFTSELLNQTFQAMILFLLDSTQNTNTYDLLGFVPLGLKVATSLKPPKLIKVQVYLENGRFLRSPMSSFQSSAIPLGQANDLNLLEKNFVLFLTEQ